MPHEQNQHTQWFEQETAKKADAQPNAHSTTASSSFNSAKNCKQPPIPCEQLLYLATTLAVALSKGKTAAETELIAQFLTVTVTSLTSLAFCKAKNENLSLDMIIEEL